jgi:septum formation protein
MKKLILASGSPRRKELLGFLQIPFLVIKSDIEEKSSEKQPEKIVVDLARIKGEDVFQKVPPQDSFVISSDTIVVYEDKIYGKPKDEDDSRRILKKLAGQTHYVYTAVHFMTMSRKEKIIQHSFFEKTAVRFDEMDKDLLELYVSTKDGMDKAGSYGIQNEGLLFVDNLKGSYSNVVGFPLNRVYKELKKFLKKEFAVESPWSFFKE